MKFFQRLIRAFRQSILEYKFDFFAESEAGWTDDDSIRVSQFFETETGKKLRIRLSNYTMRAAILSVQNPGDCRYHCGVASGINLAVNQIEQHLVHGDIKRATLEGLHQQPETHAEEIALN